MEKTAAILAIAICIGLSATAQPGGQPQEKKQHRDISQLVSDLTPSQKRKIETISRESKERVQQLRSRKKEVCDSIAYYMDIDGDHSAALNPLFENEARLQILINKEMYTTKCHIDQILTKEQRAELRKAAKHQHHKKKH